MRRKTNEQTIREVIDELLERNHMKGKLAEVDVINHWEELVGALISKQTEKIYFAKGKLFLHITSPPLKNELHYSRSKIVQIVNDFTKQTLIDDVVIK